jgi:hypothetical protein
MTHGGGGTNEVPEGQDNRRARTSGGGGTFLRPVMTCRPASRPSSISIWNPTNSYTRTHTQHDRRGDSRGDERGATQRRQRGGGVRAGHDVRKPMGKGPALALVLVVLVLVAAGVNVCLPGGGRQGEREGRGRRERARACTCYVCLPGGCGGCPAAAPDASPGASFRPPVGCCQGACEGGFRVRSDEIKEPT